MRPSLVLVLAGLGALAATAAVAQTTRSRPTTPPMVVQEAHIQYETPPGVALHDWVPLGPSSGIALQDLASSPAEAAVIQGVLWAKVHGRWHRVSLQAFGSAAPSAPPTAR